ncbi:MAG TPA: LytTR family DNA-binding domain-containing protein [Steroidobacteraceae bacterium]|jgi:two-component system response regulator AlgR|nr:LytTR family DNA-binding domain-containing protein [Steroidobacteraceae bacterium]
MAGATKLKVLIVDDEPPARERLRSLLAEIADVEVAGEAVSGHEALRRVEELAPDVVLLDVRMPGMDGVEAARHLNVLEEPPAVIFTTAYDQYAVEAFESNAVGYLMKPVRKEQLAGALARAGRLTRAQLQKLAASGAEERRTHIAARHREGLRLIPIDEVQYFLADQKYTTVHHVKGEDLIEDSLRLLEGEFGGAFVRIHRNALVGVKYLDRIDRNAEGQYFVHLRGCEAPLAVSRRMAGELKERFRI